MSSHTEALEEICVDKEDLRRTVMVGGRYRHFKGNEYIVLMLARDSETMETVVVYQDRFDAAKVWVRPEGMFLGLVEVKGKMVNRFVEIDSLEVQDG